MQVIYITAGSVSSVFKLSRSKSTRYEVPSISFQTFFVQAFRIVGTNWKFTMLLLYILWDDCPIFMISDSNEQLQQQLEYTLLKPNCHRWWISKMQSGREDALEEQYAIKFCFKLGKNTTEMYGMLQTAFWPSCMNWTSVFEWHKRFKEGRESVRNDERCGRSKEVRTPELIDQIKNFMDKDRCVAIVWELYTQLFTRNWRCGRFALSLLKGAQRRSERKTLSWQQGNGQADQFTSCSSWCSGDLQWKLDLLLWPRDQETEFPVEACWLSPTQEGQTEQIHPQTFDDPFLFLQHWHDLHALGYHWTDSQQGILCWGF